jgi:hypothetical protein
MRLFLAAAVLLAPVACLAQSGPITNLPGLVVQGGENKFIEAKGKVALTDGILEFIAVESEGRDYESLFTIECKPSALEFALLLIGAETGAPPNKAKSGEKIGDRLNIEAEWRLEGKTTRVPVHQLLIQRRNDQPLDDAAWIFTGSYFIKDISGRDLFIADAEQAFISLWWNPAIPINLGGDFGNPYRADDQGFRAHTARLPPKGTTMKLIFRKAR